MINSHFDSVEKFLHKCATFNFVLIKIIEGVEVMFTDVSRNSIVAVYGARLPHKNMPQRHNDSRNII